MQAFKHSLNRDCFAWMVLLALISLLALFLRVYQLSSVPPGLYWDEVAIAADAKSIAQSGLDLHGNHWFQAIFPSYGDYKLPVYIWLSSLVAHFTTNPLLIARLPALFIGIDLLFLTALLTAWLLLDQSKDRKLLFTCALMLMAITPWAVHFSRVGFEAFLGQYLLAVAVLLATRKKFGWVLLSQLVAALAVYSYFSVRFVWLPVFVLCVMFNSKRLMRDRKQSLGVWIKTHRSRVIKLVTTQLLTLLLFAGLFLPLIKSPHYQSMLQFRYSANSVLNQADWAVQANELRETAGNSLVAKVYYHRNWLMARQFLINLSQNLSLNFLFITGDHNLRHHAGYSGQFLLPMVAFFLIGIIALVKSRKIELLLLVGWWLVSLIPASVPSEVPHALRSLNALVPLTLITAFGLFKFVKWLVCEISHQSLSKKIAKISLGILLFIILLVCLFRYAFHYFRVYPSISAASWQADYDQLAEYVCQTASSNKQVIVQAKDDRFFLWVLAYCDWNQADLAAAKYEYYHLKQVGSIYFDSIERASIDLDQPTILITYQDEPLSNNNILEMITIADEHYRVYQLN